ncbi:SDR family NAD(P)-dependent oxidoreductase [Sphingobium phenoxybenzoativorans]|uniref:SDR family NAD(P)-dependent oxidoreductase n=1 Tax=Sphingobium phenoxybenzoativorans TaxID=1592790 RepID=UPI000871D017|nr:SDR family oxidoreductase [Sphingobium phenoxybenzoativorans]
MKIELADRAILITGAGHGLGRAYAFDAARRGASVLVNDIDGAAAQAVVEDIRTFGGRAEGDVRAVGTSEAGEAVVDACLRAFGRVDGLINNAGIFTPALPWEMAPERVEEIVRVNLLGTIHTGVAALKEMRRNGAGAIVNIVSGSIFGLSDFSIYGATKGAVLSLTYAWSKAVTGTGIHIHGLSPLAMTAMMKQSDTGPFTLITPAEVAPLASYLLSDRALRLNGMIVRLAERRVHLLKPPEYTAALGERNEWDFDSFDSLLDTYMQETAG